MKKKKKEESSESSENQRTTWVKSRVSYISFFLPLALLNEASSLIPVTSRRVFLPLPSDYAVAK